MKTWRKWSGEEVGLAVEGGAAEGFFVERGVAAGEAVFF